MTSKQIREMLDFFDKKFPGCNFAFHIEGDKASLDVQATGALITPLNGNKYVIVTLSPILDEMEIITIPGFSEAQKNIVPKIIPRAGSNGESDIPKSMVN